MLLEEVKAFCTMRYQDYYVASFQENIFEYDKQTLHELVISLEWRELPPLICPHCQSNSCHKQTDKRKKIYDVGYKGYLVTLSCINDVYECNRCQQTFTFENKIAEGKKNFSNKVREIVLDNRDLPCRELANFLLKDYAVKMCSFQANLIAKEKDKETFEVKRDLQTLEEQINNGKKIYAVLNHTEKAEDYFMNTVLNRFDILSIFKKYLIRKSEKKIKYPSVLYIMSSISSRLRNQVGTYLYPFAMTSAELLFKMEYNILNVKNNIYFATTTFLRFIYAYTGDEIVNEFNKMLQDIIDMVKPNTNEYILDSTLIDTKFDVEYESAGVVKIDGATHKGYKVTVMYRINNQEYDGEKSNILIPYKAVVNPANDAEATIAEKKMSLTALKKGSTVIIDRGYTDKDLFDELLEVGVYVIIPARRDSHVLRDSLNLVGVPINDITVKDQDKANKQFLKKITNPKDIAIREEIKKTIKWEANPIYDYKEEDEVKQEITLVKKIPIIINSNKTIYVNVALIRYKRDQGRKLSDLFGPDNSEDKKIYYYDEEYNYAAIYTTNTNMSASAIVTQYAKRMLIESQFRQTKQEWKLGKLKSKRYSYICYHFMATLMASNIFQIFKTTEKGIKYGNKTISVVKEIIGAELARLSKVFVATDDTYYNYDFDKFLDKYDTLDVKRRAEIKEVSKRTI